MLVCAIRTVIIYVLIVFALRLMGKRQIGELRPSELVVALLIADLASVPMQENGTPLLHGVLPILILAALELLTSALMLKCPAFERLMSGNPIPVIRDGKLDIAALKKLRLTVDDLSDALRMQNCFNISEIDTAVVETNGSISVFLQPAYRPATCMDVQATSNNSGMPAPVIADGSFCPWGLQLCGKTKQAIETFLSQKRLRVQQVFWMTITPKGNFYILTDNGKTYSGEAVF